MSSPALRISHIVTGRQSSGSRVSYLIAPDGTGEARAAPEAVVLKRWRQRKMEGHTFSGARLSSTLWRAVAFTFPDLPQKTVTLSVEDIEIRVEATRVAMKRRHLSLPSATVLRALFQDLGPDRLQRLTERHTSDSHRGKSGVPDLYLFARLGPSAEPPSFSRFVEVKKPKEKVSKVQAEEIAFMQSLGFQARVLRLIERH